MEIEKIIYYPIVDGQFEDRQAWEVCPVPFLVELGDLLCEERNVRAVRELEAAIKVEWGLGRR